MGQMTKEMRTALISTVKIVRGYKGMMNEDTLFSRGVNSKHFRAVRPNYIRRADTRGEDNQGVVQCIRVAAPDTVTTSNVYNCRLCPLFMAGSRCDAGQQVRLDHQADDRNFGASRRPIRYGKASRRSASP